MQLFMNSQLRNFQVHVFATTKMSDVFTFLVVVDGKKYYLKRCIRNRTSVNDHEENLTHCTVVTQVHTPTVHS